MRMSLPAFKIQAHAQLIQAAASGDLGALNQAAAMGADLDATDTEGRIALQVAAGNGMTDVVMRLLNLAADIHVRDADGHTALHAAAVNGHADIVKHLLLWDSVPAEVEDAARAAFHGKQFRTCAMLLKKLTQADADRCTALLQSLQQHKHLAHLDQAIMENWVADTSNPELQQAELKQQQVMLEVQQQDLTKLLVRIAGVYQEQHTKLQPGS